MNKDRIELQEENDRLRAALIAARAIVADYAAGSRQHGTTRARAVLTQIAVALGEVK